jgi:hypothetical protein
MTSPTLKHCKDCGTSKPHDGFYKNRAMKDGLSFYCKPCHRRRTDAKLAGPDRARYLRMRRDGHLDRKYKRSADWYDAHKASGCWVCGHKPGDGERALAVDHDHSCCPGETSCGFCVRALLCQRCNQGIGQFREDPALLRAAADYIERCALGLKNRDPVHMEDLVSLGGHIKREAEAVQVPAAPFPDPFPDPLDPWANRNWY